jgi:hypothetical protein
MQYIKQVFDHVMNFFFCKEIVERRNKRNVFLRQNECLFCLIHLDIEGRWIDQDKTCNNFSDETVLFTSNKKRIFIFGTFSKQTLVYNLLKQWKSFLINKEKNEKYDKCDKCVSSKTGPTVCQRIHHSDEKWEIANQERKVSTSHTYYKTPSLLFDQLLEGKKFILEFPNEI